MNETDGHLDAPQKWKSPTTKMTSVNINSDLYDLAKQCNLTFKEAMEFGIKFLVTDKEGVDYPSCNLLEKLHKTVKQRNALMLEVDALRQQVDGIEDIQDETKKEIDEVFGAK